MTKKTAKIIAKNILGKKNLFQYLHSNITNMRKITEKYMKWQIALRRDDQ